MWGNQSKTQFFWRGKEGEKKKKISQFLILRLLFIPVKSKEFSAGISPRFLVQYLYTLPLRRAQLHYPALRHISSLFSMGFFLGPWSIFCHSSSMSNPKVQNIYFHLLCPSMHNPGVYVLCLCVQWEIFFWQGSDVGVHPNPDIKN